MIELIAIALLCASNIVTGAFLYKLHKNHKTAKKDASLDMDATALLSQLMGGGAVVVTGVLNKEELFMWSPKARQ